MAPLFFENEIKRNKLLEKQLEVKEQELETANFYLMPVETKLKTANQEANLICFANC